MLILLVEDDDLKARTVERMVLALTVGVDVERARGLDEAFERLDDERPDAVITDWCFPVAPGHGAQDGLGAAVVEACERMGIEVVVVSGSERPATFKGAWSSPSDWLGGIRAALERAGVLALECGS